MERIRWLTEPAPWRGLKVTLGAGAAFAVLVAAAFVAPSWLRLIIMALAFVAWVIAGAGMGGHFRWSWKRGREGKVGFGE